MYQHRPRPRRLAARYDARQLERMTHLLLAGGATPYDQVVADTVLAYQLTRRLGI
ncbi:hypothetical protein [Microcystis phage Mwe-JY05]